MDKAELLDKARTSREQLDAALAQVPDARREEVGLYEAWSVKDLLGHLGWWEERAAEVITSVIRDGAPSNPIDFSKLNAVNAGVYAEYHQRPFADVQRFEQAAYQALLRVVEQTRDDALFNSQRFAWTQGEPLMNWVAANTYDHYAEHLPALQAWLEHTHTSK
jgi:hypothetical protein